MGRGGPGEIVINSTLHLGAVDWAIMLAYFGFVLGIGVVLKRSVRTSTDFFLSGRAIPATVFLAIFMMPFYYGSRVRSVPAYLRLRFDEKTRAFNAISFSCMTVVSSGISMYAMGLRLDLLLGLRHIGGWSGLTAALARVAASQGFAPGAWSESWRFMGRLRRTLPAHAAAGIKGGWLAIWHVYPSEMAQNFWTAIVAWSICFGVTISVSLATGRGAPARHLRGLVYSQTTRLGDGGEPWYRRPVTLGVLALACAAGLNIVFW